MYFAVFLISFFEIKKRMKQDSTRSDPFSLLFSIIISCVNRLLEIETKKGRGFLPALNHLII